MMDETCVERRLGSPLSFSEREFSPRLSGEVTAARDNEPG
jgi:hypothetical protein